MEDATRIAKLFPMINDHPPDTFNRVYRDMVLKINHLAIVPTNSEEKGEWEWEGEGEEEEEGVEIEKSNNKKKLINNNNNGIIEYVQE